MSSMQTHFAKAVSAASVALLALSAFNPPAPANAAASGTEFFNCNTPESCATNLATVDARAARSDREYAARYPMFCDHDAYMGAAVQIYRLYEDEWGTAGYQVPCETTLPFAQMLLTDIALWAATDTPAPLSARGGVPLIDYAREYAFQSIDYSEIECELRPRSSCPAARYERDTQNFIFFPGFFDRGPGYRAATFVHEARHHEGLRHDAPGNNDTRFEIWGAHAMTLAYLRDYALIASRARTSRFDRCRSRIDANNRVNRFEVQPRWLRLAPRTCR